MAIRNWKDIPLFKDVTDEQWNDRKIPVSFFGHGLPYVVHKFVCIKCRQIFAAHKISYRYALIDKASGGKGIMRRTYYRDTFFFGKALYQIRYFCPLTYDHTCSFKFNGT